MRSNTRVILLCGLLTLSFVHAETVFEPIGRFSVLRDRVSVDANHNKLPVTGNGELGGRWVLHRQRAFWGLVRVESPSMISVDSDKIGRIDASGNARFIINPDFLVGGYVDLEGLVAYPSDAPLKALDKLQDFESRLVKIHTGVDLTLLPLLSKMPWPLQITIGGHITWDSEVSNHNSIISDMCIPHDIGGATLRVAADYTQTSKVFGTVYYRYHDGEIKHRADIQHNGGVGGGFDYHLARFATLTAEGWWDYHSGLYVRFGLKIDGLGAQNFSDRSLQSYLKRDIPKHVAPLLFLSDLTEEPEKERGRSRTRSPERLENPLKMKKSDRPVYHFELPTHISGLLDQYCDTASTPTDLEHLIKSSGNKGCYAALSFLRENKDIEESDKSLLDRLLACAGHDALDEASAHLEAYNKGSEITLKELLKYLKHEEKALKEAKSIRGRPSHSRARSNKVAERGQSGHRSASRVSRRSKSRGREEETSPKTISRNNRSRSRVSETDGRGRLGIRSDNKAEPRSKSGVRKEHGERKTPASIEVAEAFEERTEADTLSKLSAAKAALIQRAYFEGSKTYWKDQAKELRATINERELFRVEEQSLIRLLPEEDKSELLMELLGSLQKWPIEADISLIKNLVTNSKKAKLLEELLRNNAFEEQCKNSLSILDKTIAQLKGEGTNPQYQQENYYYDKQESELVRLISKLSEEKKSNLLIKLLEAGFTDEKNVLNDCIQKLVEESSCSGKIGLVKKLLPEKDKSALLNNLFKEEVFEEKEIPTKYLQRAVAQGDLADLLLIIQNSSSITPEEKGLVIEIERVLNITAASQTTSAKLPEDSGYTRALININDLLTEKVTRAMQLKCVAPSAILDHTVELIRQTECVKVLSVAEQKAWQERWSKHLYDKHIHRYVSLTNKLEDLLRLYKAQKEDKTETLNRNYILCQKDKALLERLHKKYAAILKNSRTPDGKYDTRLEQSVASGYFAEDEVNRGRDKVRDPRIAQRTVTPFKHPSGDLEGDESDTENKDNSDTESEDEKKNTKKRRRSRSRSRHGSKRNSTRPPSTRTDSNKGGKQASHTASADSTTHTRGGSGSESNVTSGKGQTSQKNIEWSDIEHITLKDMPDPVWNKGAKKQLQQIEGRLLQSGEITQERSYPTLLRNIQEHRINWIPPEEIDVFNNIMQAFNLYRLEQYLEQKKEELANIYRHRCPGKELPKKASQIAQSLVEKMESDSVNPNEWEEEIRRAKIILDKMPSKGGSKKRRRKGAESKDDAVSIRSSRTARTKDDGSGFFGLFKNKQDKSK